MEKPNIQQFKRIFEGGKAPKPKPEGQTEALSQELSVAPAVPAAVPPAPVAASGLPARVQRAVDSLMGSFHVVEREAQDVLSRERRAAEHCVEQLLWHARSHDAEIVGIRAFMPEPQQLEIKVGFLRHDGYVGEVSQEDLPGLLALSAPLERLMKPILQGGEESRWEFRLPAHEVPEPEVEDRGWSGNWEAAMAHSRAVTDHLEARNLHPEGSPQWNYHQAQADRHAKDADRHKRAMNEALEASSLRAQQVRTGTWDVRTDPFYPNDPHFGDPSAEHSPALGRVAEIRPVNGIRALNVIRDKALLENLPQLKDTLDAVLAYGRGRFDADEWRAGEDLHDLLSERDTTEEPWRVVIKPLEEFGRPGEIVGWRVAIYLPEGQWGDAGGDHRLIQKSPELLEVVRNLYLWAEKNGDHRASVWEDALGVLLTADPSFRTEDLAGEATGWRIEA